MLPEEVHRGYFGIFDPLDVPFGIEPDIAGHQLY
jgi:hypothetical protein